MLTNFIENNLETFITENVKVTDALRKYSTGNLNLDQIVSDFKSDQGPTITDYEFQVDANGQFDPSSNSLRFSKGLLSKVEKLLEKGGEKAQYGLIDFTGVFIEEYTHYGDALDGVDAVQVPNGTVINNPNASITGEGLEPDYFDMFDEGEEARTTLYPLPTGRQNYHLYNSGEVRSATSNKVFSRDPVKIDKSMIPEIQTR